MNKKISRRQLLTFASSIAASAVISSRSYAANLTENTQKLIESPFKLGVASGDPLPDGFVLWTRLLADVYDVKSLPPQAILVSWQIAEDEKMKRLVCSGHTYARPENAHAVHIDVSEMAADKEYYYRFTAAGHQSPIGRTKTMPLFGQKVDQFRFAFASCQDVAGGYYAAYKDMVEQDPSLIIHTGDYIYETEWTGGLRRVPVPEAYSLDDYRGFYTRYKLDPNLQLAHAHCPWLSIMDDHEVDDNWGGDFTMDRVISDADYLKRKTAAFKAYYEHMPLRLAARVKAGATQIYQNTVIGDLIQFSLLDCRQYRDAPACLNSDGTAPRSHSECDEAMSPERSMLGAKQENWLSRSLGSYGANWNSIVQMGVMAPLDQKAGPEVSHNPDGWDGYGASRQKILDALQAKKVSNPISLGGDIHAFYSGIVNADATRFDSKPIMSEFVTTSISSGGGGNARYQDMIRNENQPLRFFENRVRGYSLCDVSHDSWQVKLRRVNNVLDPNSTSDTLKTLVVENNKVEVVS